LRRIVIAGGARADVEAAVAAYAELYDAGTMAEHEIAWTMVGDGIVRLECPLGMATYHVVNLAWWLAVGWPRLDGAAAFAPFGSVTLHFDAPADGTRFALGAARSPVPRDESLFGRRDDGTTVEVYVPTCGICRTTIPLPDDLPDVVPHGDAHPETEPPGDHGVLTVRLAEAAAPIAAARNPAFVITDPPDTDWYRRPPEDDDTSRRSYGWNVIKLVVAAMAGMAVAEVIWMITRGF